MRGDAKSPHDFTVTKSLIRRAHSPSRGNLWWVIRSSNPLISWNYERLDYVIVIDARAAKGFRIPFLIDFLARPSVAARDA